MNRNKELGQYFTPEHVAEFMVNLASVPKSSKVLEPSAGEGVFLKKLRTAGFSKITAYEVDSSLNNISDVPILNESFVSTQPDDEFDLVIGNPPYIRWKNLDEALREELSSNALWNKYFNSMCDYLCIFILKSVELLKKDGELIFITPEYWINTKHAEVLRTYLVQHGHFTDIIHFKETPIFEKVASSILIFKYKKGDSLTSNKIKITKFNSSKRLTASDLERITTETSNSQKDIDVFERPQFKIGGSWTLIPQHLEEQLALYEQSCKPAISSSFLTEEYVTLGSIADIGNGMVSGLDDAFQLPQDMELTPLENKSTISVLKAKNMDSYVHGDLHRYIFLEEGVHSESDLKSNYPNFYKHLEQYKDRLESRYQYNRKIPYWEWVFLRSFNLFRKETDRIFIPCKERISHKNYFRFSFVRNGVYPTQDVTAIFLKEGVRESIYYITALLNDRRVFDWLQHKGVVKGNIVEFSEKPLASIPLRLIDWSNQDEVMLHDSISNYSKEYIETRNPESLSKLQRQVATLF